MNGLKFKSWPVLLCAGWILCACKPDTGQQPAKQTKSDAVDLILVNDGIYTVDDQRSWAEAMAIKDGVIVLIGDNADIQSLAGPDTRRIDLTGKMAMPGFHDAHVHPAMGGYGLLGCLLAGQETIGAIIEKVAACAANTEVQWLEGFTFNLGLFGQDGPHRSLLDAIDTDLVIFLNASDGHTVWVNSRALKLAGITAQTPDPPLGVIERDADGSPSGTLRETAALIEPYVGMHGHRGDLILEPDELQAAVTKFDAMGLQVHMHAIGDRAVRAGLDAIEAARSENGVTDYRHHISHLQMIHIDDIERFASLDASANFQALWALPDECIMELNLGVVGEERVQAMYPIASVERAGGRIVGGSDWDVSSANPLDAIEVAVRRQDWLLEDGPVLNENEKVSLETMIEAYTIEAAWLMHQDDKVGSIEVGKRADIVVLDRNLFEIPSTEINQARVLLTVFDGKIIYQANE